MSTTASSAINFTEKDGIIYFSIFSEGLTAEQWLEYFEKNAMTISSAVKNILLSMRFKPTIGEKYFAIIKPNNFTDETRTLENIKTLAQTKRFRKLNAETICLLREALSDHDLENFGLKEVIVMRTGYGVNGNRRLAQICRKDAKRNSNCSINTTNGNEGRTPFGSEKGFAFYEKRSKIQ